MEDYSMEDMRFDFFNSLGLAASVVLIMWGIASWVL